MTEITEAFQGPTAQHIQRVSRDFRICFFAFLLEDVEVEPQRSPRDPANADAQGTQESAGMACQGVRT